MEANPSDITMLLAEVRRGNDEALGALVAALHKELRRIAARHLRRERSDHTLQPTALVNEAYMRLVDQRDKNWQNRAHFFAIAARAMRRILVDHARARLLSKRGGGAAKVPLDDVAGMIALPNRRVAELVALDDALHDLARFDARKSRVVELRFFGGLSVEETAEALGVSAMTVMRDWVTARAWLHRELGGRPGDG